MTETRQVSALIGDIYDAALDPELWPRVLERGCRFVGGVASNLYSEDSATNIHYTWASTAITGGSITTSTSSTIRSRPRSCSSTWSRS